MEVCHRIHLSAPTPERGWEGEHGAAAPYILKRYQDISICLGKVLLVGIILLRNPIRQGYLLSLDYLS